MVISLEQRFWLCTIGLILVWAVVLCSAQPTLEENTPSGLAKEKSVEEWENQNTRDCKDICSQCGCIGFYCGEECICECSKDTSDTECINRMRKTAFGIKAPYELLIQGPISNRLIVNAKAKTNNVEAKRKKRSTVVIYTPSELNSLESSEGKKRKAIKDGKMLSPENSKHKRSISQLDWFTDLANTLVRPAPLNGHKEAAKQQEEAVEDTQQSKRATKEYDHSWFSDSASRLLKPAPLFKRQRNNIDADGNGEDLMETSMKIVEKFPKMIKDTIQNIQETALNEDFTDAIRLRLKDATDVFQNQMPQAPLESIPPTARDSFQEVFSNVRKNLFNTDASLGIAKEQSTPAPDTSPKFTIPWFRPVRFLQRVQQSLNNNE